MGKEKGVVLSHWAVFTSGLALYMGKEKKVVLSHWAVFKSGLALCMYG